MARKEILIATALTVAGLAGGYWLLPKDIDVAQMEVRDYNYDSPEQLFESRFQSGDHSVEVVQQLVRIHSNTGNIDRAIEVMQTYVDENPTDMEALKQLGRLYQHAQRYEDYMRLLERRTAETTDPAVLAELNQLYRFFQDPSNQKAALERLYEVEQGSNADTLRSLATFYSVEKEFDRVADLMDTLRAKHADAYTYEDAVAHTHALLETGRKDEAVAIAEFWRDHEKSLDEETAFLIDMLHYQGSPAHAKTVFAAIPQETIYNSPDLLHSYVLLLLADNKRDEAYRLLVALYERDNLPPVLLPDLMYLAAVNGNLKQFEEVRAKEGLGRLPEGQLADIWIVARQQNQGSIVSTIEKHVAQAPAGDYPQLRTMILIRQKSPARHAALRDLLDTSLNNDALLRLADVTASAGDKPATRDVLAKLPEFDQLTIPQLASLESIYLRHNDKALINRYLAYLDESDRVDASSELGLRAAAAQGDGARLTSWYNAYGRNATPELLSDLFYHASNSGHLQLALTLAEWQNDPRQRQLARAGVAGIYTRLGRYEQALSLLEETPIRTEEDVRSRAYLLTKLAPRNPSYGQRLNALAGQWFKPSTSRRTKEDLTYSVLSANGQEAALPYMKGMADQYAGDWTLTYAYALAQAGRAEEATPYYLKAAKDPKLDTEARMNIAYALVEVGQREAAEGLLIDLADDPATRLAASRQLAYLWGPRPTTQQLDWMIARWQAAEGAEKDAYAEMLMGKIGSDQLEARIAATPELRRIPEIDSAYLYLLAEQKRLLPTIQTTSHYAQQTGDVDYLLYLGKLARDYGAYPDARVAYEGVLAVNPQNQPALLGATITAGAQADYPAIDHYFQRYEAVASNPPQMVTADIHEAYFAYAENLRRANRMEAARPYYAQAVNFVESARLYTPEALSVTAQSAAWMGDDAKSQQVFDYAFSRYPQNAILHADKTSLLIEQRRYDDAWQAWERIGVTADANAPKSLETAMLTSGDTGTVHAPQLIDNGRQMLVRTSPESTGARYWVNVLRQHPAVSYVSEGYDSVLVVSKSGYRFTVSQPQGSDWMAAAEADAAESFRSADGQLALRKELMAARMELETGKLDSAANRMDALEATYSEDPQYLGFSANSYYYGAMWPTAKELIAKAAEKSPDNTDIQQLKRSIDRYYPDHVRTDMTLYNRGDNREIMNSISGETQVAEQFRMGAIVRNHNVRTKNELQPSGLPGSRKDDRQSAELYGIYSPSRDSMLIGHLYANNDTAGLGLDYSVLNPLGVTTLSGRYHEPYFEFVEGILDDTVRDRLAISHMLKPSTKWQLQGGVSYNNYSAAYADDIMSTVGVEAAVNYVLRDAGPYISLGYGLNAEYELDNEYQTTTGGAIYRRFPLRSREIHFGSVNFAHDFSEKTYGTFMAGYGWDRLGGDGPAVEGTINHEFIEDWDIGARAFYGLSTTDTDDSVNMINGYVRYRF